MTYRYPIPGSASAPSPLPDNYFYVGNQCCGGSMSNDIDATTKVTFDYTNQLPAGVNVSGVVCTVTPPQDQMLIITSPVLALNIVTFFVSKGAVGQSYSIESIATLSDGQIWVDHIMVMVIDCDASIGAGLLFAYSPISIANTLYYNAIANQTVFNLTTPDEFGRSGVLADSNVLVYVNGLRKEPVDEYTVNVRFNTITFMSPLSVGTEITFDLVAPPPLPPPYPLPVLITGGLIATTLYYLTSSAQSVFSLWTPDRFNHIGNISTATGNALVYVNGLRQEPTDDYTISLGANTITFTNPVPAYSEVDFDLVTSPPPQPVIPPPYLLNSGIISTTLYYSALGGQTVFSLGMPDIFNNVGQATINGVQVYRSGNRLTPSSDYMLNIITNQVILNYPAGIDEPIIIELTTPPPPPVILTNVIRMDVLSIVTANTLPPLPFAPDSAVLILFVNGTAFFAIGPQASFTVSGKTLTWTSTIYSIPVGAAVIAVYTHA